MSYRIDQAHDPFTFTLAFFQLDCVVMAAQQFVATGSACFVHSYFFGK